MAKLRETTSYIFKYLMQDAWFEDIYEIKIYDRPENNLIILDYNTDSELDIDYYSHSLKKESLDKIKELLDEDIFNLRSDEIEKPSVMDGTIHKFMIRKAHKTNDLCGFNLWAFEKKHAKPHPKAEIIMNLVYNIKKILESEEVNTTHFGFDF